MLPDHLRAGRAGRAASTASRIRRMSRRRLRRDLDVLRRDLQRGVEAQLRLRRPTTKEDLDHYAQEMQLVFDRDWFMVAEDGDETVGDRDHDPGHQPGAAPDERAGCCRSGGGTSCARRRTIDRVPRRLPRGQAGVPAHGRGRRAVRRALRHGRRATPIKWGEMGWILETNRGDEPRDGGHERARSSSATGCTSAASSPMRSPRDPSASSRPDGRPPPDYTGRLHGRRRP